MSTSTTQGNPKPKKASVVPLYITSAVILLAFSMGYFSHLIKKEPKVTVSRLVSVNNNMSSKAVNDIRVKRVPIFKNSNMATRENLNFAPEVETESNHPTEDTLLEVSDLSGIEVSELEDMYNRYSKYTAGKSAEELANLAVSLKEQQNATKTNTKRTNVAPRPSPYAQLLENGY